MGRSFVNGMVIRHAAPHRETTVARSPVVLALCVSLWGARARGEPERARVQLELYTGGKIAGWVLDHNEHGLVIIHDKKPYVFGWQEVQPDSAVASKFQILAAAHGGADQVPAKDYFLLGEYALSRNRNAKATALFRTAQRFDPELAASVREAVERYRPKRKTDGRVPNHPGLEEEGTRDDAPSSPDEHTSLDAVFDHLDGTDNSVLKTPEEVRAQVTECYLTFGKKVREVLGDQVKLIESEHFLIWTDWPGPYHARLIDSCESMYNTLCRLFGIPGTEQVFLAKCPIFCFESKARFLRFARSFDNHDGAGAVGYTRAIERNGHVHMVLLRRGREAEDFDRFAYTLTHEGTHAFIHRIHSSRLIPNWVNEGLAEFMSDAVLGDKCPARGNADLLAKQYVLFDWPVAPLIESTAPIEIYQYALAHSLVAFLDTIETGRLSRFVRRLKQGRTVAAALAEEYNGLTPLQFETRWRDAVRAKLQDER